MSWIAAGVAIVGAGVKIYSGIKQNQAAKKMKPQYQQYQPSPYAKEQLAFTKQMFNAPMPGLQDQIRGIQSAQSNTNSFVQRNATDSAQALSLGELNQGQANNNFTNLGQQQRSWQMGLLSNLNQAYGAMIGEGDKQYKSMFDKYNSDVNIQQGLRNAGMQNVTSGIGDISSGISQGIQYNSIGK